MTCVISYCCCNNIFNEDKESVEAIYSVFSQSLNNSRSKMSQIPVYVNRIFRSRCKKLFVSTHTFVQILL